MAQRILTLAVFNRRSGWTLPPEHAAALRSSAPEGVEIRQAHNFAELIEYLPETDYLVGFPITAEQITPELPLKWIQLAASVGDSTTALRAARAASVRITTASSIRALPVAEHALACTLALTRALDTAISAQQEHRWAAEEIAPSVTDLASRRALIIASEAITEAIVHRLAPFGSKITAATLPGESPASAPTTAVNIADIDSVLPEIDLLIVAAPRVGATDKRIGRKQLDAMSDGAILIDVSRGGIVSQKHLIEALRREYIAGAALDVFESEPLPQTSPLWTMPNVIVTPHVSSASPGYWHRAMDLVRTNLERIESGQGLVGEVPGAWYEANGQVAGARSKRV